MQELPSTFSSLPGKDATKKCYPQVSKQALTRYNICLDPGPLSLQKCGGGVGEERVMLFKPLIMVFCCHSPGWLKHPDHKRNISSYENVQKETKPSPSVKRSETSHERAERQASCIWTRGSGERRENWEDRDIRAERECPWPTLL